MQKNSKNKIIDDEFETWWQKEGSRYTDWVNVKQIAGLAFSAGKVVESKRMFEIIDTILCSPNIHDQALNDPERFDQ